MTTGAGAGPDWRKPETRRFIEFLTWVRKPKHLVHPLLLCPGHQQVAGTEVEQPGLQPVPMWHATTIGGLIYKATV